MTASNTYGIRQSHAFYNHLPNITGMANMPPTIMMLHGLPRRMLQSLIISIAMLLTACGGGGDGSVIIPPFWLQSGVVIADFNADGRADVAVATTYIAGPPPHPGYVEVYLQTAAGSFNAPVRYAASPDPWGISVGDMDGDGRMDIVAASHSTTPPQINVTGDSGAISILRQDTANPGAFQAAQLMTTGGAAEDAAIADINGDGLADIVVADGVLINGRALLLQQIAPNTFMAPTSLLAGVGRGSQDLEVADLNGDGYKDVVLAAYDSIVVFYRNVAGGFAPPAILAAGLRPSGVAVADIDGDGRADIIAANAGNAPAGGVGGASVTILRQTVPGAFIVADIAVEDGARRVAIADLDGDGLLDIAAVSLVYQAISSPSRVSVLLQSAANRGQFTVASVYNGSQGGSFIAVGDVNGDGRNDIVLNDGPGVLLQSAVTPGVFNAVRALR